MGRLLFNVPPCSCGAPRVIDLDQPNLIQCDNCRHDEGIDSTEVSKYERKDRERAKGRELETRAAPSEVCLTRRSLPEERAWKN